LIEDRISQASTQRTVPIVVEANGQTSADRHWALYLAPQDPRGRIAQHRTFGFPAGGGRGQKSNKLRYAMPVTFYLPSEPEL
jgi:hypothetical protein